VCAYERERVHVYVWVLVRERVCVSVLGRVCECVGEREREGKSE